MVQTALKSISWEIQLWNQRPIFCFGPKIYFNTHFSSRKFWKNPWHKIIKFLRANFCKSTYTCYNVIFDETHGEPCHNGARSLAGSSAWNLIRVHIPTVWELRKKMFKIKILWLNFQYESWNDASRSLNFRPIHNEF